MDENPITDTGVHRMRFIHDAADVDLRRTPLTSTVATVVGIVYANDAAGDAEAPSFASLVMSVLIRCAAPMAA
jgi:hypothetical protein